MKVASQDIAVTASCTPRDVSATKKRVKAIQEGGMDGEKEMRKRISDGVQGCCDHVGDHVKHRFTTATCLDRVRTSGMPSKSVWTKSRAADGDGDAQVCEKGWIAVLEILGVCPKEYS